MLSPFTIAGIAFAAALPLCSFAQTIERDTTDRASVSPIDQLKAASKEGIEQGAQILNLPKPKYPPQSRRRGAQSSAEHACLH